jgi:hypothetical protein
MTLIFTYIKRFFEWVIMYTIVFTEVPGVSDHEYDCVHWSTWSEWSCIRLCSLKYLEWVIMNTIVLYSVVYLFYNTHNDIESWPEIVIKQKYNYDVNIHLY